MFLGRFAHNLDDKGRMTIPIRFREILAAGAAYVTQGFDPNLIVLPQPVFEAWSKRIDAMNMTDPDARLLRRHLYSTAAPVELDRAGRILLPQYLRDVAGLRDGVVLSGMGRYFEIWSPENWTAQEEKLLNAEANDRRYATFDLSTEG
jgi:MraZ protein